MFSPTCGKVSLQKATKFIAFVDLILGLTGIFWFVYMLERFQIISLDPFEEPGSTIRESKVEQWGAVAVDVNTTFTKAHKVLSTNHKAISLTLFTLFDLINLTLFVVLLLGAHRKNIGLCLTWFYVRCAVFVFKVILFIIYLISGRPLFGQIPYILFMFIHLYGLWVVNSYAEELKTSKYQGELNEIQEKKKQEVNDWEDANGIENVLKLRARMEIEENAFKENKGFEKL